MENKDSKKSSTSSSTSNYPRKPIRRRRSHTGKKIPQDCSINIAQARREIVNALHLHRSSSSSSSTISSSLESSRGKYSVPSSCQQYYGYNCYSVMESLPFVEPTWSATAPSILAPPPPPTSSAMENSLEFECVGENENQAASYTWWFAFLKTLDNNNNNPSTDQESSYSFESDMGNSVSQSSKKMELDGCSMGQYLLDEWLTIPTTEDQVES